MVWRRPRSVAVYVEDTKGRKIGVHGLTRSRSFLYTQSFIQNITFNPGTSLLFQSWLSSLAILPMHEMSSYEACLGLVAVHICARHGEAAAGLHYFVR